MNYFAQIMKSPVGQLTLVASKTHLLAVLWENDTPMQIKLSMPKQYVSNLVLEQTESQLNEYFAGKRTQFELPILTQGTHFQKTVWTSLQTIPYGTTLSYSDLALQVGSPRACRAVGSANGKNPISIINPCHRVIGKTGSLNGFAGGLNVKDYLLKLEQFYLKNE